MKRSLAIAAVLAMSAAPFAMLAPAQASRSAHWNPKWMTESDQFHYFGGEMQAMIRDGDLMLSEPSVGDLNTNIIHYTRFDVSCFVNGVYVRGNYMMPCQSVADSPPVAGQWAMLDIEKWMISAPAEQASVCKTDAAFADQMRSMGVIPVMTLYNFTSWHIRCAATAAGSAGYIALGDQNEEDHPAEYLATLNKTAAEVTAANPALPDTHMVFGISTRAAYRSTPKVMATAYLTIHRQHPLWICWVNVITFDHTAWKAEQFAQIVEATTGRNVTR